MRDRRALLLRVAPALAAIVIAAGIWLLWNLPDWQLPPQGPALSLKDRLDLENGMRAMIAQIVGGTVVLVGLYFTWRQLVATRKALDISMDGQITDRLTKAIEQLGSDKVQIRLGGIYALERISRDSERDYWPIMEVLTAYVRDRAPVKDDRLREQAALPIDIQAVLTVIGRRQHAYLRDEDQYLDLRATDLRGANLTHVHLEGARLMGAHLEDAVFGSASLNAIRLTAAHMERVNLIGADLTNASLADADLQGAKLTNATLFGANLRGANLRNINAAGANLQVAHLDGANLQDANLQGANLIGAELLNTCLAQADLRAAKAQGADLSGSDLRKANLRGTDLTGACGLTHEQIEAAITGTSTTSMRDTRLPDYVLDH